MPFLVGFGCRVGSPEAALARGGKSVTAHSFISSRAAVLNYATSDALVMTWDRCVGVVWKRETTLEGVEALATAYREQATRYPSGVYLLTIIEHGAPMPSTEEREAVAVFLRSGAGRTRMSAVVSEGTGFRAAAVRSVVTGLAMLVRLPYPHEVFGSLDQAAKWLGTSPYNDLDPDYTVLAVTHARRQAESGELKARRK
jgi:hypothetical protein